MPDLQKPIRQMEQRLGDLSREILRIEAHLRRGEARAASARIDGVRDRLQGLRQEVDTPLQLTLVGAQLGLLSGGGSWLRGRLPAALLGGVGGWMYGQSVLLGHHRELDQLADHVDYLDEQLSGLQSSEGAEASETSSASSSPQ